MVRDRPDAAGGTHQRAGRGGRGHRGRDGPRRPGRRGARRRPRAAGSTRTTDPAPGPPEPTAYGCCRRPAGPRPRMFPVARCGWTGPRAAARRPTTGRCSATAGPGVCRGSRCRPDRGPTGGSSCGRSWSRRPARRPSRTSGPGPPGRSPSSRRTRPPGRELARIGTALPWFVHDAVVHYLSPRGLEQYTGGAWGTRDVSQGPVGPAAHPRRVRGAARADADDHGRPERSAATGRRRSTSWTGTGSRASPARTATSSTGRCWPSASTWRATGDALDPARRSTDRVARRPWTTSRAR